jgi:hypothetical protein
MAVISELITIPAGMAMPSLGVLIGSRVSHGVFDQIQETGHSSFFGSEFDTLTRDFFQRHVEPLERVRVELQDTMAAIMNPDYFRILQSFDAFRSVPLCMELPILMFGPVKQAFLEGRLEGYGYNPESLPEEDVFGRMIDNSRCEDVEAASDANGYYTVTARVESDDPELSDDDLWAIERTRDFILSRILNETDRDPTAIDQTRG